MNRRSSYKRISTKDSSVPNRTQHSALGTRNFLARPYFWLINFIGLIVPRRLRADWRQEWASELENRETLLCEWDRLDWRARLDLSRRSLGAFFDALRLQPRRLEDEMFQDLRFGARMLAKSPGFTAAAVLTLALGIGANAAIFGMVDALVIRPLNLRELPRLVVVSGNVLQQGPDVLGIAPADFVDLRREQSVFEDLTAYQQVNANLTGAGEAERVQTFQVSANFFRELSVTAALGRPFLPEEESPGRDQVAILSYTFWQHRFGADPQIIGKTIALDGRSTSIIGVMPELFDFPRPVEIWTPLAMSPADWNNRGSQYLSVIGRLKPGIEVATAQAEMKRLALKLATEYPQTNTRRGINAELLSYKITNLYTRTLLWMLMGAVGFILLIACVNIANMQLARATTRSREIAIRAALGAGRGRIIRQLLTESLLLGTIGGLSGLALSFWFLDLLRGGIPADQVRYISGWETMAIDSRVVLFNFAVSFAGGLIFGLAPAWQFSKPDLSEALKEGGRGSAGGARQRMRNLLIVSEVALALVLLVGAGLLGRGFMRMVKDQKTGFNPTNVLTMRTTLTTSKYSEAHQITAFYQQALARLSTLAGVESASAVYDLPASGSWDTRAFTIEGRPALQPGESRLASYQVISANYFQTMRIPLRRGREFNEQDGEREPRVAIISESLARRYFPGEDPLGRRVAIGAADAGNRAFTIVGVVGDVSRFMFDREPEPTLYLPHTQASAPAMYFAVRTAGDPVKLLDSMRAELARVDPDLPYYEVKTLEKVIDDQLAGVGMVAGLIVAFGAMALLLSAAGVYGVMAYAVAQRTHEIGIRMALGARPRDVLRLVVGQAVKLTAIGAAIGLPAAFALSRLMASILFGIVSLDLFTFILFTVTLAATAVIASYLPARRAAKVDPMIALRYE